jgi:hypothetical protein
MTLYIHHVPGRLRLKTRVLKGDPAAARGACRTVVAFILVGQLA